MNITQMKRGRVYTWPEVQKIVDDIKTSVVKNQEAIFDAMCADHERSMLLLCLRALQRQGFQKAPLERLMMEIADLSEAVNAGLLNYDEDIRKPVEDCLGYEICDRDFERKLEEKIR